MIKCRELGNIGNTCNTKLKITRCTLKDRDILLMLATSVAWWWKFVHTLSNKSDGMQVTLNLKGTPKLNI